MLNLMLFAPQMNYLQSAPQITPLSTKFMHERGGVLQLDIYPNTYLPIAIES